MTITTGSRQHPGRRDRSNSTSGKAFNLKPKSTIFKKDDGF
jgi:hypothetical protein